MREVSATDANREFSKILREVREGETVTVTSKGKPVAVISPFGVPPGQAAARASLLARLKSQSCAGIAWTRDELYDDSVLN